MTYRIVDSDNRQVGENVDSIYAALEVASLASQGTDEIFRVQFRYHGVETKWIDIVWFAFGNEYMLD